MSHPVEFRVAVSSSSPTGTGSYYYHGSIHLIVQNLAYEKEVSVWAREGSTWNDIPATYVESLPGNLELWKAPGSNSIDEFVAKYKVNGVTYWDNNWWMNYIFPKAFDSFNAITGCYYPIILGSANLGSSNLKIMAGVQNLDYVKVVGAAYTTDNWVTAHTAYGYYSWTPSSGLEVWQIDAPVSSPSEAKFALFYQVLGNEYWDNNFWRDYTVTPATPIVTKMKKMEGVTIEGVAKEENIWLHVPQLKKGEFGEVETREGLAVTLH